MAGVCLLLAARHAAQIARDFVECGVGTGIVSPLHRLRDAAKAFLAVGGISEEQALPELELTRSKNRRHYFDFFDLVANNFARYPNVQPVKGVLPASLEAAELRTIAYLHIDMNIAYPEVQASRALWDKMTPGDIVVYDDYAAAAHAEQKKALDAFAAERAVEILALPTGQGMLLRP
jgi:hypothetical protein